MSIWTDLLFLHGHIATSAAIALVTPHPRDEPAPPPVFCDPPDDEHRAMFVQHPLRTVGQLP